MCYNSIVQGFAGFAQVDKRMVTQMLAAYLEQSNHPKAQHEILTKMAETRRDGIGKMLVFQCFMGFERGCHCDLIALNWVERGLPFYKNMI